MNQLAELIFQFNNFSGECRGFPAYEKPIDSAKEGSRREHGFYRFKPAWFLIGSLSLGRQLMGSTGGMTGASTFQAQPAVTIANLFLRIAYRF